MVCLKQNELPFYLSGLPQSHQWVYQNNEWSFSSSWTTNAQPDAHEIINKPFDVNKIQLEPSLSLSGNNLAGKEPLIHANRMVRQEREQISALYNRHLTTAKIESH